MRERLAELVHSDPNSHYYAHVVGIGEKIASGQSSDNLAICIYVLRKTPLDETPSKIQLN